jgi:hypothetical protein
LPAKNGLFFMLQKNTPGSAGCQPAFSDQDGRVLS